MKYVLKSCFRSCAAIFLLASCSTTQDSNTSEAVSTNTPSRTEIADLISEVDTEMDASRELKFPNGATDPQTIPLEVNKEVEKWLHYFTVVDRERFQRFLDRGEHYKVHIQTKLTEMGVPRELYYLAMIESGFAVHAYSHASAVGIWQFIKPTGERYGLQVNNLVDERRDPSRSTIAAASYLKDLYTVFQSWFLAMAAYNAGESRIMGAIMRAKTRNFWELARLKALPKETMNYVPKFIAASIIGHHPEKFGFAINKVPQFPKMIAVKTPSRVYLHEVAATLNVPLDDVKLYNPHVRGTFTPDYAPTYDLWVPETYGDSVNRRLASLANLKRAPRSSIDIASTNNPRSRSKTIKGRRSSTVTAQLAAASPSYHVVRKGETLASVAKNYGVSQDFLKSRNDLKGVKLVVGKRLMLTPESNDAAIRTAAVLKSYKVRRGDNLHTISRRFGIEVLALKKLNNLRRNHLYAGEIIKLVPKG